MLDIYWTVHNNFIILWQICFKLVSTLFKKSFCVAFKIEGLEQEKSKLCGEKKDVEVKLSETEILLAETKQKQEELEKSLNSTKVRTLS